MLDKHDSLLKEGAKALCFSKKVLEKSTIYAIINFYGGKYGL